MDVNSRYYRTRKELAHAETRGSRRGKSSRAKSRENERATTEAQRHGEKKRQSLVRAEGAGRSRMTVIAREPFDFALDDRDNLSCGKTSYRRKRDRRAPCCRSR
jgi:hypothetical protein